MDAASLAKEVSQGGVSPVVVYILAFFVFAVVLYLIKDYAQNHKHMLLVLENSNRESRLTRKLLRKHLPKGFGGKRAGRVLEPPPPLSRRAAQPPNSFPGRQDEEDGL